MASVLCTGADRSLIATRKLILERAGHTVVAAAAEAELIAACEAHSFDVAVIGQTTGASEKRRILSVVREHSPEAKNLELYSPVTGKVLPEADDWLQVHSEIPADLVQRVVALAS